MNSFIKKNPNKIAIVILSLIAVAITFQRFLLGDKFFDGNPYTYTQYNNYVIFKQSFFHLIQQKDLYVLYLPEHWDLFKYTPTFALFMGIFAWMPDYFGLGFWNLLNVLSLGTAILFLPRISNRKKIFILAFILIEMITSIQNAQSNPLIAGLIVWGFVLLEKGMFKRATFLLMCAVFIKPFGIVAFSMLLLFPRISRNVAFSMLWFLLLLLIPLIVIPLEQLIYLYESWLSLLAEDHGRKAGMSVLGLAQTWTGLQINKNILVLIGAAIFCLPLLKPRLFRKDLYRYFLHCSVLIWIVIFNHMAEPATYIIALVGVGIWYFMQEKNTVNLILVIAAFVLSSLSATDLFPSFLREEFIVPYQIKVLPCLLIWIKITWDMLKLKGDPLPLKSS